MKLVNQTPLAARLIVSRTERAEERQGMVWAKATFRWSPGQQLWLDREQPLPLLGRDETTDLGLLPRDDLPRSDESFEVVLLGVAHAPGGAPVPTMTMALSVGDERRELHVFGDREWLGKGPNATISNPVPFMQMPLVYERAFGGSVDVLVDRDALMRLSDPFNPRGRGFDPAGQVATWAQLLKPPAPYPRYDERRLLPNIESATARISGWQDAPSPACWCTVPMGSAEQALRCYELPDPPDVLRGKLVPRQPFHRAHPDWVVDLPAAGAPVIMQGLTPEGHLQFALPQLRVFGDYAIGGREGTWELRPQMLVLLPERRTFYLVYRCLFAAPRLDGLERSLRLRTETGWIGGTR